MQTLWQDLRFGVRMLIKKPGFTLVAVLTLALGIGVNTAIFSTVNGFILRPLAVERPDDLVMATWGSKKSSEAWNRFSYPNYVDYRDSNQVFSGLLVWQMTSAGISNSADRNAADQSRADVIWGELVSGNYFDMLGVKAALGRTFSPEEDRVPNGHPVVVLGHNLWRQRFTGDPSIVGKQIYLNGFPFTVIGVGPPEFKGVKFAIRQDFWAPTMMAARFAFPDQWHTRRGSQGWNMLGRLKPGVTIEQAKADLNRIADNLAVAYPETNADARIQVLPEVKGRFYDVSDFLGFMGLMAMSVAGLVLLISCANVANLLLARAAARSREIGVRLALGAGRIRIIRQLLTESVLLASLGGVIGLLFAYVGTNLVHASVPPLPYPISLDFNPDLRVLKWTVIISLLTGVIFGLAPALLASRADLVPILKGDSSGNIGGERSRRWNLRGVLVMTQVALSIVILVCAGLFLRSLNRAQRVDPGFRVDKLVTMMLDPGLLNYSVEEGKRFYQELLQRMESQPGVRAASLVEYLPLGDSNSNRGPVLREGDPPPKPGDGQTIDCNLIAPKYFETMQGQLVAGRDFNLRDNDQSPRVVIVNQEFARRLWGGEQQALGKRVRVSGPDSPLLEVVGVAKDGLYLNLYENRRAYFYLPEYQGSYNSQMTLLVSANSSADLTAVADAMRRQVRELDSRVPVFGLQMAERNLSFAYWGPRLGAGMASAFGVLALLLATMGLYSVMSYSVSRRTREIGVRMALGAERRDILKIVIGEGLTLVGIGVVVGLAGAFGLTRVLAGLLFGVSATDPMTFALVVALLLLIALLACYIPARRATRVDPMTALRTE
jgi:macrolide transport system ATP-binding/permease protein